MRSTTSPISQKVSLLHKCWNIYSNDSVVGKCFYFLFYQYLNIALQFNFQLRKFIWISWVELLTILFSWSNLLNYIYFIIDRLVLFIFLKLLHALTIFYTNLLPTPIRSRLLDFLLVGMIVLSYSRHVFLLSAGDSSFLPS